MEQLSDRLVFAEIIPLVSASSESNNVGHVLHYLHPSQAQVLANQI